MEVGDKIKLCSCGCGNYITYKKSHKYKKIPNRLVGHQQKWNEGLTKETDERVNKMYKEGLNKKCPICKKIFYIRNSAIKTNRTCSKKCGSIYLNNIMKGKTPKNIKILLEYIKNYKVKRINKNCLFCENKIETTIKNNKRYCSRKCYWNNLKKQGAPKHFIGYKHSEHSRKLIGKKSLVMWNKENFINRRFGLMHKYTSIKEIINLFLKK